MGDDGDTRSLAQVNGRRLMERLLVWIGLAVGGWLGWFLGSMISVVAAIFLSIVGTALGLYIGRRVARDFF